MTTHEDLNSAGAFAVVIPVGPDPTEIERTRDLLHSIRTFEPGIALCVLIDDTQSSRDLRSELPFLSSCEVRVVRNPRNGSGQPKFGGLCAGILAAFRNICATKLNAAFVLKIDPDALVIKPFHSRIQEFLHADPDVGLTGAFGRTCRREDSDYGWERKRRPKILDLFDSFKRGGAEHGSELCDQNVVKALDRVRPEIESAVGNGYCTLDYCQGGAYAVTTELISRMLVRGYLDEPEKWAALPIGEDVAMGLYAYAAGLRLQDYSEPGQPFGVHWRGLPYSPPILLEKGYSIVHSTKRNADSETDIREFFAANRSRLANSTHHLTTR